MLRRVDAFCAPERSLAKNIRYTQVCKTNDCKQRKMALLRKTPLKRSPSRSKKPLSRKKPSLAEVTERFNIVAAALLGPPKRKPMKKRSANNKGWVDVARKMWDDPGNDHRCEVCGMWLGDEFSPTFYHHLLHRGSYRKMARRPENLAQVCLGDHDKVHDYGVENLAEEGAENPRGWMLLATRLVSLRNEAHGILEG